MAQPLPTRVIIGWSLVVEWDAASAFIQRENAASTKPSIRFATLQPNLCLVARHAQMTHGPRPVQALRWFEHGGN